MISSIKAFPYLVLVCCTFLHTTTVSLLAADPAPQTPAAGTASSATSSAPSPEVRSFLETTHFFDFFANGYKKPWQKRLLENKTGEKRAALESLIDALAREIINDAAFKEVVYQLYAKHFTAAELKTLEDFYKSEVGVKIIKAQTTRTPLDLSATDQQALDKFSATPFGQSAAERMTKIVGELQQGSATIIDKHQKEYFPKFRELDR